MRCRILFLSLVALTLAGCASQSPQFSPTQAPPQQAAPAASAQPAPTVPAAMPAPAVRPRATGTPEDARRHMVRGMAAIEMAKSAADFLLAEDEFRMATEISPQLASAWFNLGTVQSKLGRYSDAMASYREYLALAPAAEDAPRVRDELIKLEFRQEQQAKRVGRVGTWVGYDGTPYHVTMEGERLKVRTNRRRVYEDEVRATYPVVGTFMLSSLAQEEYLLAVQGNRLAGTWERKPLAADKCTIPADSGEVSGELDDGAGTLLLHHPRTSYRAAIQMQLLSDDVCGEVVAGERKNVDVALYGPLPKGGLGVVLYGLTQWWEGGFSSIQLGWQGHLGVRIANGSPAFAAGLRDQDEIIAIDNVPVKSLSAVAAVMRLRGAPGTPVTVTLKREDVKEPLTITMQRIEVRPLPDGLGEPWIN